MSENRTPIVKTTVYWDGNLFNSPLTPLPTDTGKAGWIVNWKYLTPGSPPKESETFNKKLPPNDFSFDVPAPINSLVLVIIHGVSKEGIIGQGVPIEFISNPFPQPPKVSGLHVAKSSLVGLPVVGGEDEVSNLWFTLEATTGKFESGFAYQVINIDTAHEEALVLLFNGERELVKKLALEQAGVRYMNLKGEQVDPWKESK